MWLLGLRRGKPIWVSYRSYIATTQDDGRVRITLKDMIRFIFLDSFLTKEIR